MKVDKPTGGQPTFKKTPPIVINYRKKGVKNGNDGSCIRSNNNECSDLGRLE